MVAGARPLLVRLLVLLVDDDDPGVLERAEQRGARAHDDARGPSSHHVPLIEALAGGKPGMEDGDPGAESRAEPADGLGCQRDLGNKHARPLAAGEHALDGGQVDLRLSRARDAVDQDDPAAPELELLVDRGERFALASRELGWGDGLRRRERRAVIQAAPRTTLLDPHDAAPLERADGG